MRFLLGLTALAMSSVGFAKVCKLEITGNDQMQYDKKSMEVAADCTEIEVTLKHIGKLPKAAMGHDWVLTETKDEALVVKTAMTAGIAKDYLPDDKSKIIAFTKLIGGGESTSVTFSKDKVKAGTAYTYFCTFPGHAGLMKGEFKVLAK